MKTLEIIGYKRANLGKTDAKLLRAEAQVPCVLYGADTQLHFSVPMFLFRDLVYTPEAKIVNLTLEGKVYRCILQEIQIHPVNEMILHVDFFLLDENKPVRMNVPVKFEGTAVGILKGGKMAVKQASLKIKALPANLPDFVAVDITNMDLGKSVRVRDVKIENFEVLQAPELPIATVIVPRALKGKDA